MMTMTMTHDEIKAAGFHMSRFGRRRDPRVSYYLYCGTVLVGAVEAVTEERNGYAFGNAGRYTRRVRTGWAAHEARAGRRSGVKQRPAKTGFDTVNEAATWLIERHESALGLPPREAGAREEAYLNAANWLPANERERWVRRTRESVVRALAGDWSGGATAAHLEDNLDIGEYMPSLGFVDRRSMLEIQAALRWLAKQGLVEEVAVTKDERREFDMKPGQKMYRLTRAGFDSRFLANALTFPTARHAGRW